MSPFPPLYERWMGEVFADPVEGEPDASCDTCAMLPSDDSEDRLYFDSLTKCCTYLPALPNFQTGGVLSDDDEGADTVRKRMRERAAVTPLGVDRKLSYALRYRHKDNAFGRDKSLRCPHHLDDGRCGVWRHRGSTCATWFCKHERGAIGYTAWRAFHRLLSVAERHLSLWCVKQIGLDNQAVLDAFARGTSPIWREERTYSTHLLGGALGEGRRGGLLGHSRERYSELWGDWAGREEEFFIACATQVASLSWGDVVKIADGALDQRLAEAIELQNMRTSTTNPNTVRRANPQLVQIGETSALLRSYGAYDPREIPRGLYDALDCFDGGTVAHAQQRLEEEHGLKVSDDLVRKLVDFQILVGD